MNLRELARGKPCYLRLDCCNGDPSTTVLAHIRRGGVAGVGQKPCDLCAIPMCSSCHDEFDRRTDVLMVERITMDSNALRALVQWLAYLHKNGKIKVT